MDDLSEMVRFIFSSAGQKNIDGQDNEGYKNKYFSNQESFLWGSFQWDLRGESQRWFGLSRQLQKDAAIVVTGEGLDEFYEINQNQSKYDWNKRRNNWK